MKRLFEFESDAFPRAGEDDELASSETMYGHALATFLASELGERGFKTRGLIAKDWGWLCTVEGGAPVPVWFRCAGEDGRFVVQIRPHGPRLRRWFHKTAVEHALDRLAAALFATVAETRPTAGPEWI